VYARRKSAAVVLSLLVVALAAWLPTYAAASEQPALTLTATPAVLTYGLPGHLAVRDAVPGAALTLFRKRASEPGFVEVGSGAAEADGTFVWRIKPPESTLFRVDQSDAQGGVDATAEATVGVRHRVTLTVTAASRLIEDGYVRYRAAVRPLHAGGTARLQRRAGDDWVPLADVRLNGDSVGSVRLPAGKPGRLVVRAQMIADASHLTGSSRTWKRTVYDRRNPYGVPVRYAHLILVDLSKYKLYYHEHGIVVRVFDCVLGRPSLPTPRGHYRIYAKDPHMGGPYGPYRMRYLGLYAIHGTNEPWLLGRFPRNYSHGCTRLSNADITWLYRRVPVGTPVWNVP
jgi:hypothetical protein